MKIVLDTNVLISGIFFSGPPHLILQAWRQSRVTFAVSEEILDEYHRVARELSRKYPVIDLNGILHLITVQSKLIDPGLHPVTICDDPDDNKFIECALAGGIDKIVSGDKHLLKISGYRNIQVFKPGDFVDTFLR